MQIYNDQGEDAMMEAMMQDIGGYMFDRMETLFTGAEQKKYQMRFDLVQDENEWKIVEREQGIKDEKNPYDYEYITYVRR